MPQFDTETDYVIPLRTARGKEQIAVRWPTEEEWATWYKSRPLNMTSLGRGQTVWETDDEDADARLYAAIRTAEAPQLDPAEAHELIQLMSKCDVTGVESEGDELALTARVMGGEVTHRLKIPHARQVRDFRRGSSQIISLPFGKSRVKSRLEPGVKLWDDCRISTEGYVNGGIPGIHKDAIVRALLSHVDEEADEGNP